MTNESNNFLTCEDCGETNEDIDVVICPYAKEINEEIIECALCPNCYSNRAEEI